MRWDLTDRGRWEKARARGRLKWVAWEALGLSIALVGIIWTSYTQWGTDTLFWVVLIASLIGLPCITITLNAVYTSAEKQHAEPPDSP